MLRNKVSKGLKTGHFIAPLFSFFKRKALDLNTYSPKIYSQLNKFCVLIYFACGRNIPLKNFGQGGRVLEPLNIFIKTNKQTKIRDRTLSRSLRLV